MDIVFKYNDYRNFLNFLNDDFNRVIEVINPLSMFVPTPEKLGEGFNTDSILTSFQGDKLKLPRFTIIDPQIEKFDNFESYTSTDEVNNISLWTLSALQYLNKEKHKYGKELEIPIEDKPRNGRLDVVIECDNNIVVLEAKTDLVTALSRRDFLVQLPDYQCSCEKEILKIQENNKTVMTLLGIGGNESLLYPPDCKFIPSGYRRQSRIFFDMIIDYEIKFISANSIWALFSRKYYNCEIISLSEVLNILKESNCLGLLTAGFVKKKDDKIIIEKI